MSFIYMFFHAFFESLIYKKLNSIENRNFHSSMMFLISAFVLFFVYLFYFGFNENDFSFLQEWKFYLLTVLEIFVFYLYRENYYQNKSNYTMISMFVFSTIYLMPILAFIYNPIFNFNETLDIKYSSFYEAFIFSLILFFLSSIYYASKIKNKEVKNLKLLILLLIVLLNTMYFSVKVVQTFNGILVYSFIQIVIAIYFLVLCKNESKQISLKRVGLYLAWPVLFIFYVLAASIIAVEFITIFKRVSQIISAMILDKKVYRKDFILIALIILVSICFYLYKLNQ